MTQISMPTPEQLFELAQRVSVLEGQMTAVASLLNIPQITNRNSQDRTETGMGPLVSPERTSFL